MATFDPFADAPFQIKHEGQELVVRQSRTSPTTIRVTWTLPAALSCNMPFAYNGAIVTLDEKATSNEKLPVDGNIYHADPTANANLHSGSTIGSARVVGVFYNDVLTNFVDIEDAPEEKSFFVSVHAVDNVRRYHTAGAHSYSLPFGRKVDEATAGYQIVKMGLSGVTESTNTSLSSTSYAFKLSVDEKDVSVSVDGGKSHTYGDLIDHVNETLALRGNPIQSANRPNEGKLWLNSAKRELKLFNGETYIDVEMFVSPTDPLSPSTGDYWFNSTDEVLNVFNAGWSRVEFHNWPRDPRQVYCNDYWFDGSTLRKWNGGTWIAQTVITSNLDPQLPPVMTCQKYWIKDGKVYQWDEKLCKFVQQASTTTQPPAPESGQLWINAIAKELFIYSDVDGEWVKVDAVFQETDPSMVKDLSQGIVWHDTIVNAFYNLDGTSWVPIKTLRGITKPQSIANGAIWFNTVDKKWYKLVMDLWTIATVTSYPTPPNIPTNGRFWYQQTTQTLRMFDTDVGAWTNVDFSPTSLALSNGTLWYNTATKKLQQWNGAKWMPTSAIAQLSLDDKGNIKISSGTLGSKSSVVISDAGTFWNTIALDPTPQPQWPVKGTDPQSSVPSYMQLGVGTDGSQDERREMISRIKNSLGFPVMQVELTKEQMDQAVDMALEKLRAISSAPYKRGYFGLDILPRIQKYKLTDETVGFNKVTEIFYLYRQTAAFMGQAAANNVYGQMVIQNLFTSGKFDLLSYHLMTSQIETMRQVLATEIQFNWNEYDRELTLYKDLPLRERILVDAMIERSEQDLMTDRKLRPWIQKYATAQCRYMLAEIRGKFTTLPGAGGSVSLNASDLRATADKEVQECIDDVDNYVIDGKTEFGAAVDFILG